VLVEGILSGKYTGIESHSPTRDAESPMSETFAIVPAGRGPLYIIIPVLFVMVAGLC
jgi:hypothetical protein